MRLLVQDAVSLGHLWRQGRRGRSCSTLGTPQATSPPLLEALVDTFIDKYADRIAGTLRDRGGSMTRDSSYIRRRAENTHQYVFAMLEASAIARFAEFGRG